MLFVQFGGSAFFLALAYLIFQVTQNTFFVLAPPLIPLVFFIKYFQDKWFAADVKKERAATEARRAEICKGCNQCIEQKSPA
ncbi:MAG: hypothetical protein ACD_2C00138G0003 [uncultured bacterium (gcode 4)]|uniref:Uncharacterized protein n=1 Tax=uncultured bacterium (gcode 4) TaxID=1234023 RepID=K2H197_9BACT|nr:MAG: hypothetical protein ACD_2C00138G0003 [uncultured bacterium (gcode 4)]